MVSGSLVAFTLVPLLALLASAVYATLAAYRLRDWRPALFVVVVVLMAVHQSNELSVYLETGVASASSGFGEYPETGVNLLTSGGAVALLRLVGRQQELTTRLSEQLERERELEKENERLEEFASIVAHDLKNPLNVAYSRAELLRQDEGSNEHVDSILRSLDRMETIVTDTLTLAREGMAVEQREQVSVAEAAWTSWQQIDTGEATLSLESEFDLYGEESRIRHIFENLFRNAIEHGPEDVTVRVGRADDATLYVEDDGPGIPEDKRDAVLEAGHTTEADGTGFGLAIVNRMARAHGWEVTVTESDDGGARFEFTGVTRQQAVETTEPMATA